MKKIFYFIASAIVALGAVACQNDIDETIDNNQQTEGLSIKVTIDEQTRVELGQLEDNKRKLTFTEGDVLVARANRQSGTSYLFECTKTEGDVYTFTCTAEGVSSLVGTKPWFFYLGGLHEQADELTIYGSLCNTAAEDLSGIGLSATSYDFDHNNKNLGEEGHMVSLHALPLLKFTANEPVTFKSTNPSQFFVNGWADSYTTKKTGEIYLPIMTSGGECAVTVTTESGFNKTFTTMFEENKIYNLGTIEKPFVSEKSAYGVVGSFQGWEVKAPVAMYTTPEEGWLVAEGVELYKGEEIKIVKGNTWDVNYGLNAAGSLAADKEHTLTQGGNGNIKIDKNGIYNLYFNESGAKFKYTYEAITGTVNITINNVANWSPVYITLKSGDTTIVSKATVLNNVYAISKDFIGESLDYTLTTTGDKSISGKISVTKAGASINLVEEVIKLTFQLDTDNTKQWWGTKSYIYIWNTDTSVNNSWPGVEMISDGNHTWHYDLPASLAGKKLTYIIYNGVSWQSADSTLILSKDGHTIKGSEIGIK